MNGLIAISLMHTDPTLLIFVTGVLVGAAVVLLARRIPDVMFLVTHMRVRRRTRTESGRRYFLN